MNQLTQIRKSQRVSERTLVIKAGISRETIRSCVKNPQSAKVINLEKIATALGQDLLVLVVRGRSKNIFYPNLGSSQKRKH